ncbi:phosphoenolpyruvate--protein phosphotransferase [Ignavibacteriales bacterium]
MKGYDRLLRNSFNWLKGIPAAPGLYIGKSYVYSKEAIIVKDGTIEDIEEAVSAFNEALERSKKELDKIFNVAKEKMGEQRAAIFEAQLLILEDPDLVGVIQNRIVAEKREPESIVKEEFNKFMAIMYDTEDVYMKERANDIEDIRDRIIRNLKKERWSSQIVPGTIVISESLTPADTILFSRNDVKGYITEHGGLTSHAAIIARSLSIPAVLGVPKVLEIVESETDLIVDGFYGYVFINPTEEQIQFFKSKIQHLDEVNEGLKEILNLPPVTLDGVEIDIQANVDVSGEIEMLSTSGTKGIGLYRTEQLIEELGEFPDEETQTRIYSDLSARIYPELVTIRAFDLGGDKTRLFHPSERNPFLGLRGIRFLLDNKDLFKHQIKAILRSSINRNIRFMLPMVSTIKEIRETRKLIEECKIELTEAGKKFSDSFQLGIMIEVPSAAVLASQLAPESDFFSIGTNDLIQYMMAVDRGNDLVVDLYQEFHPAVIRTLSYILEDCKDFDISISICGEMAADTLAVPLLIGLGIKCLSVSPAAAPPVKRTIRSFSYKRAKELADECIKCACEEDVIEKIMLFFDEFNIQRTRHLI